MTALEEATGAIVRIRDQRDWAQFHTLKNLAAAVAVEAAELQEVLLWKTDSDAAALPDSDRANVVERLPMF